MEVRTNKEKQGIEVVFEKKPEQTVIETLKYMKFRWSPRLGYWWRPAWGESASAIESQLVKAGAYVPPVIVSNEPLPAHLVTALKEGRVTTETVDGRTRYNVADTVNAETIPF